MGYPPVRVPPCQAWWGYLRWGSPLLGYPLARFDGGTQGRVPPLGYSPNQDQWGVPKVGYSPSGYTLPARPNGRGTPIGVHPLVRPDRGYPKQVTPWSGYPCWGTQLARPDGGVPEVGYPPGQVWLGVYPRWCTPPGWTCLRVPPAGPGWGTLPSRCGQTDTCENSTLPSYYVRGR